MSLWLWQFRAVKGLAQNIYTSSVLYILNKHIIYNLKLTVSTRLANTESPTGAWRENEIYNMYWYFLKGYFRHSCPKTSSINKHEKICIIHVRCICWFLSWWDFSSCYKVDICSEATLHIFWFCHIMMFIFCNNNVRKKRLVACWMKRQLSPSIQVPHTLITLLWGGWGGQKDLHRNVFEKNTTKLINYVEMSFAMLFRFCEHIKIHPYFVKISEKQA